MNNKFKIFIYKLRYNLLSIAVYFSRDKKLVQRKILLGSMIIALFVLPACHSKKKTMCYYLYSPPAKEKGMAMQQPEQNINQKEAGN
jgi:hypothetical protein